MSGPRVKAGKALVPLLGALAALAMGVAAVAIVLQLQERDKRLARERELQLALAENDDLKVKLEETQQGKTRVEEQLATAKKTLAQAQDELANAVKAREELSRSIEDREREITRLTKDLEQASADSKQAVEQLQFERKRLADLERAKADLESKVMELSGQPTVELDKVLVKGDQGSQGGGTGLAMPVPTAAVPSSMDGQVVVINRDFDFIVMNLGRNHGLSVGQEFQIVRGSEVLGRVKVEKVYDELSAAALLPESKKNVIREGDAVRPL